MIRLTALLALLAVAAGNISVDEGVLSNPQDLLALYSEYQQAYPRQNTLLSERRFRLKLFKNAARFVVKQNKEKEWRSALNKFSDMTEEEARAYEGVNMTATPDLQHIPQQKLSADFKYPEESMWLGSTLEPLDQGNCGSCWIFGSLSTLEGRYHQLSGKLKRFSQQQMLDCVFAWRQDKGCGGGANYCTYSYLKEGNPLIRAADYPAYQAKETQCRQDRYKDALIAAKVKGT
jgi:cathepsin H